MIPENTLYNPSSYFLLELCFFLCRFVNEELYSRWHLNAIKCFQWDYKAISCLVNQRRVQQTTFALASSLVHPRSLHSASTPFLTYQITMTNITKKRNNAIQDREPSPTSSTDNPTLQELKQRHAELERQLRKYKSMDCLLI